MTMAQRTAGQVQAILADHEGDTVTAWVECHKCPKRFEMHSPPAVSDIEFAKAARDAGWKFLGYAEWRCPKHV